MLSASVDPETDKKVQNTIIEEFQECTLLVIAHRLRTILHFDRM
jgi:ABC-type multidrug transport system fused ATPase/permease subunit